MVGEEVQVVLLSVLVPFPRTSVEVAAPVGGREALAGVGVAGWLPDVPVSGETRGP